MFNLSPRRALVGTLGVAASVATVVSLSGSIPNADAATRLGSMGPSTSTPPYIVSNPALGDMVSFTSILTVGDAPVGNYPMVGIPDGLGAFDAGGNRATLLMNHELRNSVGGTRAHGSKGAFVSQWTLNRDTLRIEAGADMVSAPSKMYLWDAARRAYNAATSALDRLCSGDLAATDAFFFSDLGTKERIYITGEESSGGRAFAWVATGPEAGTAWELPRLGKFAWENAVPSPFPQSKTVVMGMEDGNFNTAPVVADAPSQLHVYIGKKQATGNTVERSGLTNGQMYAVKVSHEGQVFTEEDENFPFGRAWNGQQRGARAELVPLAITATSRA